MVAGNLGINGSVDFTSRDGHHLHCLSVTGQGINQTHKKEFGATEFSAADYVQGRDVVIH
jgi:hypothetical protein